MSSNKWIIKEVKTLAREFHERHERRKGHEVEIAQNEVGGPLIYFYTNGDGWLHTSFIQKIEVDPLGNVSYFTKNTIYTFSPVIE